MPKSGSGFRLGSLGLVFASVLATLLIHDSLRAYVGGGRSHSAEVSRPTASAGPARLPGTDEALSTPDDPRQHLSREAKNEGARELAPKASARFEGIPAPGSSITLMGEVSNGARQIRWVQTQGPPVAIDDPTTLSPTIKIPERTSLLGFVLFVANDRGTDVTPLEIRIPGQPEASGGIGLRADAGDDQVGIVGRQITLNGVRSEPRGQVAYRWVQVSGPRVRLEMDDGYIYSFVPQAPGVYQFALVVGRGDVISKPDMVTVSVGNPASPYGVEPSREAPEALHDVARAALGSVPGGIAVAHALGEAFDGIADRMDLYRSYDEAYSELGRRLEPLLPADPGRRGLWDERLFLPLTARLIEGMRGEGLDLRLADAPSKPLTSGQRARLAELFRSMSQGFHATRPGP